MKEKKNYFGKKIEKSIRYNAETDSYFVQFSFKNVSHLNSFPTLEAAREYRDKINSEKLNYKINRDIRIIKDYEEKEMKKYLKEKTIYPLNILEALELKRLIDKEIIDNIEDILSERCSEREKDFIVKFYKDDLTLEKIGKQNGLTKERVRQIIGAGLKKVKNYIVHFDAIKHNEEVKKALEQDLKDRHDVRERLLEEYRRTGVISKDIEYEFGEVYPKSEDKLYSILNCEIDELDLSIRSYNALRRAKIVKISDLVKLTEYELSNITGLGNKCAREIINKLKAFDLTLCMNIDNVGGLK